MTARGEDEHMTKYQFQIEDEKWEKWKDTVPRSKSLEQRIVELIEDDAREHGVEFDDDE